MRRRPPNYSIAWLLICTTIIAACLGVVVSPNMWTTSAVAVVRLALIATAIIMVLNSRTQCPRAPVAFLAASMAVALIDPWHSDSEMIYWALHILNRSPATEDQQMVGFWHMWSLLWTVTFTLFIMAFLKPQPLNWNPRAKRGV